MNIILDIGNVICDWNPRALISGIFSDTREQHLAYAATIDHPDWLALDRGSVSLDTAIKNTFERSELDRDKIEQIYLRTPSSLKPIESMVMTIIDLANKNIPIYILSNMPQHCWDYLSKQYNFWSLFSGIVVSYQEGLIKPEKEIFSIFCNRYQLDPSHSIFFDDIEENIKAAQSFGMNAVHIKNKELGYQELYQAIGN